MTYKEITKALLELKEKCEAKKTCRGCPYRSGVPFAEICRVKFPFDWDMRKEQEWTQKKSANP